MRVLITSGASELCAVLADHLAMEHEIRLTERAPVKSVHNFVQCALGHDRATNQLTSGIDVIVHAVEPLPDEDVSAEIDAATRCTYNLLLAAAEENVSQVILLSTLELMADYPAAYRVGGTWRPLPRTRPPTLSKHLAEQVCREFARERKLRVAVLRLGKASDATVYEAVNCALANDEEWAITHVGETAR